MHAKYALALILALQVSVSLCEVSVPSQELVDKYNEMKATFYRRLLNLAAQLQDAMQPHLQSDNGQAIMTQIDGFFKDPRYLAFKNVVIAMGEEFSPMVDQVRMKLLGEYERSLRPSIGGPLNTAIDNIKVYLDKFMPAE